MCSQHDNWRYNLQKREAVIVTDTGISLPSPDVVLEVEYTLANVGGMGFLSSVRLSLYFTL